VKTAVSIPDDVFREADQIAERFGWSRSQLYTRALRELLDAQGDDPVSAALDALADELNDEGTPSAARALIDSDAWTW